MFYSSSRAEAAAEVVVVVEEVAIVASVIWTSKPALSHSTKSFFEPTLGCLKIKNNFKWHELC